MRSPCCDKSKVKKGPWSPVEDSTLTNFIQKNGHDNWRSLPKQAGLLRCGKSCRLRWINYLRPDVKRGNFTPEEEDTIIKLHSSMGNKWSKIASLVPGRTDNEIKNVWNTHLKEKSMQMSSSGSKNCLLKSDSSRPNGEYSSVVSSESSVLNRDQDMHGKGEEEGPQIDAEMSCNQKDNLSSDKEPIKETSTSFSSSSSKMESGHEEGTGSLLNSVDSGEVYNPMHQLADDHAIETQTTDDVFLEIPMMADPTDMDIWSMLESNEDLTLPPLELTDQEGMPQNSDNGYSNIGYGHEDLVLEIEEAEYMKWLQMFRK